MANSKIFIAVDDENQDQKLEVFINNEERVFINVGRLDHDDSGYYSGWISLNKEDVTALKNELENLIKSM